MTAIAPCFRFAHANRPNVESSDESQWIFGAGDQEPPLIPLGVLTNRFVYVFESVAGDAPELYREYHADSSGQLSYCDGDVRRNVDRTDPAAAMQPLNSPNECLPDNINGAEVEYFFFATRVRLSSSAIDYLSANRPKSIPLVRVAADNACYLDDAGTAYAPAVDPLAVALQLALHYQVAANALINTTTIHAEQSATLRQELERRQNILLVARLLKGLLEHPEGSKFKNCFKDGAGHNVSKHIEAREAEVESLILERDRRGAVLCQFLRSALIEFTESLYRVEEVEHFAEFLKCMAAACDRLAECPNGRARLGDWEKTPPYWVTNYAFPKTDVSDTVFQVGRKAAGAITKLWTEFAPALASRYRDKMPEQFSLAARRLTRQEWVSFKQITSVVELGSGLHGPFITRGYMQIEVPPDIEARLANWVLDDKGPAQALESLGRMVEVTNLSLAAYAISDSLDATNSVLGFSDKDAAYLNLVGAGFDSVAAFAAFGKLGARGLRAVAGFSAVIDTVLAARDAKNAYEKADTTSMIGFTAVAAGSALLFTGTAFAGKGAAVGAASGGLSFGLVAGVAGAVVVAAGYILVVLLKDSPTETFIKNCHFGSANPDGDASEPWSAGKFADWHKGLDGARSQVKALYNLLAAFTVKAGHKTQLVITPGLLTKQSRFRIEAEVVGTGSTVGDVMRRYALEVNALENSMKSVGLHPADPAGLAVIRGGLRLSVNVDLRPLPGTSPFGAFFSVSKSEGFLYLDLFGDGKVVIPNSASVEFDLRQTTLLSSTGY